MTFVCIELHYGIKTSELSTWLPSSSCLFLFVALLLLIHFNGDDDNSIGDSVRDSDNGNDDIW